MNLKCLKTVSAALAIVATAAAVSVANDQFLASADKMILAEGASTVALKLGGPRVTAADSWAVINRRALPDFPTVQFPDGNAYRVDGLCADGANLRYIFAHTGAVCVEQGAESGCARWKQVELVTPRDYTVRGCTKYVEQELPNYNSERDGGSPIVVRTCVSYATVARHIPLSYSVKVYDTAPAFSEDGTAVNHPQVLFAKEYSIPACK